jgi:putative transposase
MGRPLRAAAGGIIYHVWNRANGRQGIFEKVEDYEAFDRVLMAAHERVSMRTLAYCVMPNHWHLVLWPRRDGDLSRFLGWLTLTHTQRWHAHHQTAGTGHLYQGRFKSFPVQNDDHMLTVCRSVERNPLRAGLVVRAEEWRWSSLWRRSEGARQAQEWLAVWPVLPPRDWVKWVNEPQTTIELEDLRRCVARGQPYGTEGWVARMIRRMNLEGTVRPRGRPKNRNENGS